MVLHCVYSRAVGSVFGFFGLTVLKKYGSSFVVVLALAVPLQYQCVMSRPEENSSAPIHHRRIRSSVPG